MIVANRYGWPYGLPYYGFPLQYGWPYNYGHSFEDWPYRYQWPQTYPYKIIVPEGYRYEPNWRSLRTYPYKKVYTGWRG